MTARIILDKLISLHDANLLIRKVSLREPQKTVHSAVMDWFASGQGAPTLKKFEDAGFIPAYSAYVLEYYLKLK